MENEPQPEESSSKNFNPEMFEDYMKTFKKDTRSEKEKNPQIRVRADEDILFDSDDEPDYVRVVAEKSLEEFEKIDMNDLDRKLTMAGLGGLTDNDEQLEYLYSQLNDEEKKMFNRLADNLQYDEMGLMNSVFGKNLAKKK
uniref:Uncharacterized protein n=1 Tax=Acrobeloides nanus TaxID=290746 RepID=A0A914DTE7_9BILA